MAAVAIVQKSQSTSLVSPIDPAISRATSLLSVRALTIQKNTDSQEPFSAEFFDAHYIFGYRIAHTFHNSLSIHR